MRQKLSLIDRETGEEIKVPIYLNSPYKRSTIYGLRFFLMAQDPLEALTKDRELRGLTTTIFLYLYIRLDFENFIHVPQQEVADHVDTSQQEVAKAIGKLVKKKILIKGPSVGRSNSYRLNPAFGWKGSSKKAHEYQLELIKGGRE